MRAVDLFAGAGGWSVALRQLGITCTGIEFDHQACDTRRAAGFSTVEGDVREHNPEDYPYELLIGSPPCQTFSVAGRGEGRANLDRVLNAVFRMGRNVDAVGTFDEKTALVVEPLRWALEAVDQGHPYRAVTLEQVPTVLPVWDAVGEVLRSRGYDVVTGCLHSEQYGVPQTRKRAVLIARLEGPARLPTPTHSRYYPRDPGRVDLGVKPWVSMAEALGWGMTSRPNTTLTTAGHNLEGGSGAQQARHREVAAERYVTPTDGVTFTAARAYAHTAVRGTSLPAPTITTRIDEMRLRDADKSPRDARRKTAEWVAERLCDQTGTPVDFGWPDRRPSTVVAGRRLVQHPGATANRFNGSGKSRNDGIRITVPEAGVLQGFPADHPWQGSQSAQYKQAGNAIPPPMARAILEVATDGQQ